MRYSLRGDSEALSVFWSSLILAHLGSRTIAIVQVEAPCIADIAGFNRPMKVFFFYDSKFVPLRDYMVASMEASGAASAFQLQEDILDDLKGNNRAVV